MLALAAKGKKAEAQVLFDGAAAKSGDATRSLLDKMTAFNVSAGKGISDANTVLFKVSVALMLLIIAVAAAVALLLGILIARSVTRQLGIEPSRSRRSPTAWPRATSASPRPLRAGPRVPTPPS